MIRHIPNFGSEIGQVLLFSGSYHNWGNLQSVQNEPDDYQGQQDALAISIDGWPLGTAGQWNDINENNNLFFVVEFNAVPVVTSASSFSEPENQTDAGMVVANDPNGDELLFSISGGNDQSHFTINSVTGFLTFISTPDFENPTDSDGNNSYEITVGVSDGKAEINQNLVIYVLDVNESWGEPIDVNESGYGVGPEFSLDTRDPTTDPPGGRRRTYRFK